MSYREITQGMEVLFGVVWRTGVTMLAFSDLIATWLGILLAALTIVWTWLKVAKEWDARKQRLKSD